jgi:hypothetical protein
MRYLVSQIAIGNKNTVSIGPWHEMMHYQTNFPWDIDDTDYLLEVGDNNKEILMAIDKTVKKLTEFSNHHHYPVTDAIYFRLFAGTNGGLSPSVHQPEKYVFAVDIVSSHGIAGYDQFKQQMQNYFMGELKAKPHWGKSLSLNIDYAEIYDHHFVQFKEALENWYLMHDLRLTNSMFLTPFLSRILKLHVPQCEQSEIPGNTALLNDHSLHTNNLAKRFKSHNEAFFAVKNATLFQPVKFDTQQAKVRKSTRCDSVKQKKSCCVLL